MTEISNRGLLLVSLTICLVGLADAFISQEWDLLVIFVLTTFVQAAIWFRQWSNRVPVDLRADLARQIEVRAERSGEPFAAVLDRSVAWSEHRLYGDDASPT